MSEKELTKVRWTKVGIEWCLYSRTNAPLKPAQRVLAVTKSGRTEERIIGHYRGTTFDGAKIYEACMTPEQVHAAAKKSEEEYRAKYTFAVKNDCGGTVFRSGHTSLETGLQAFAEWAQEAEFHFTPDLIRAVRAKGVERIEETDRWSYDFVVILCGEKTYWRFSEVNKTARPAEEYGV